MPLPVNYDVRIALIFLAALCVSAGADVQESTGSAAPLSAERPNIVFFLVDDLGWQDTSLPFWSESTPFNEHYSTPNMERLAAQGVKFSQAYACAVCSPTRTSLMTGQNAARHHVTQWTLHADKDQSGKTARLQSPSAWRKEGLQPADVTLPELLQEVGYHTIHVGKAHWGAKPTAGEDPLNLGFDVNVAGHAAGAPGGYSGTNGFGSEDAVWGVPGLEKYHGTAINLTDALTVEANAEVERAVAASKPFYLYFAHYTVHAPLQAHVPYDRAYRERGVDEPESRYASMVEGMDASLGSVLANLERLGVAENTIVLFASDNGGLSVHARGESPRGTGANTHNWPLRAGKGSAYEGGTRVPQIVAWAHPNSESALQRGLPVELGATRSTPTLIEDVFPTLLRWARCELSSELTVDGVDFTDLLQAEGDASQRAFVFHYPHVWGPKGPGYEPHSTMRLGDLKVIYFYEPQRWELYDVVADIGEEHDLASERPDVLRSMAQRMLAELERLGAQYPAQRAGGAPDVPVLPAS